MSLDAKKTFDLPWFVVGIGIAAVIYGIFQIVREGIAFNPEVFFSDKIRKEFLDE